ncbi:MAG: hypothetical protein LUQ65_13425, partial [Candidatus Helarchaeota archaeon]|nr:hypothetical protein [Candidatus Helarchaeota archaeon]
MGWVLNPQGLPPARPFKAPWLNSGAPGTKFQGLLVFYCQKRKTRGFVPAGVRGHARGRGMGTVF